jgi:hypothetical protein
LKKIKIHSFTLIEVLVSLILLSLIVAATGAAFVSTKEAAHFSHLQEKDYKRMSAVLDLMRKDLQHMIYARGDEEILYTEQVDINTGRADSINFIRMSAIENEVEDEDNHKEVVNQPVSEIGYISSPNQEDEGIFNLYRRHQTNPDMDLNEGGNYELLLNNLVSFEMNYLEGSVWTSTPTKIPRAIEINLTILQDDGRGDLRKINLKTTIAMRGQI